MGIGNRGSSRRQHQSKPRVMVEGDTRTEITAHLKKGQIQVAAKGSRNAWRLINMLEWIVKGHIIHRKQIKLTKTSNNKKKMMQEGMSWHFRAHW